MSMSTPLLESRSCCARVEGREGEGACHTIDAYLEIGRYGRHGREQSNNQPLTKFSIRVASTATV